jgi:hypothetical protein
MAYARSALTDFEIANRLHVNAIVYFYTVDSNGDKTTTLANLYQDITGTTEHKNPQTLDSFGKLKVPCYVEEPVIATITGLGNVPDYDSGIVSSYAEDANDVEAAKTAAEAAATQAAADAVQTAADRVQTTADASQVSTDKATVAADKSTVQSLASTVSTNTTTTTTKAAEAATSATNAETAQTASEAAQSYAEEWANKAEDSLISAAAGGDEVDDYSAKHFSNKAAASASAASTSETNASDSATEAYNWAQYAENSLVPDGNLVDEYSAYHWAQKAQSAATGSLTYQGSYDASGGSYPGSPALGYFYKISVAGTMGGVPYAVGDSIIYNGTGWDKIDNTEAVTSVAGKTGAVTLAASDIASGTLADARVAASNVTQHEASINHDNLSGFVANEHIDHSSVSITAGTGLTGGGTIAGNRTISADFASQAEAEAGTNATKSMNPLRVAQAITALAGSGGGGSGTVEGLKITNNAGTPNTQIDVTANSVLMMNTSGASIRAVSLSETINLSTTGANGLDTGSMASSTWYYLWAIAKADGTTDCLASTSNTNPTMPSGYTFKKYLGAMYSNGSTQLVRTLQYGNSVQFTSGMTLLSAGAVGTFSTTTPTWAAVSVSAVVPPTASKIKLGMHATTSTVTEQQVAPNNSYTGAAGAAAKPPLAETWSGAGNGEVIPAVMMLESSNIYRASQANSKLWCSGWEDYYV